ncbi:chymotrypsin-2-like [Onthophagus taurus]|uniref:chymotrypsin-2-like n=1 Tax=Onthophagus taurus TaxID=166361 RepID=UPI0039BEC124
MSKVIKTTLILTHLIIICSSQNATSSTSTFVVAIILRGTFKCAGTIISQSHVLTQANCCFENSMLIEPKNLMVITGTPKWDVERRRYVSKCVTHENFYHHSNETEKKFDIAILVLETPLILDAKVNVVKLDAFTANFNKLIQGKVAVWKKPELEDDQEKLQEINPSILTDLNVNILAKEDCKTLHKKIIEDYYFCVSLKSGDYCEGGTGGPLLIGDNNRIVQVGIIDYNDDFCKNSLPQLFYGTSYYYTWIRNEIRKLELSKKRSTSWRKRTRFYATTTELINKNVH